MTDKKQDFIDQKLQDLNNDGIDRRGFLKCMAWAGNESSSQGSCANCRSGSWLQKVEPVSHPKDFAF